MKRPDKAREAEAAPDRPARASVPSPKLIGTGMAIRNGARTMGEAARLGGYSYMTSRVPTSHGITPARAVQASLEVYPDTRRDTLKALKPLATRRLKRILEDDQEASGVVASTALAVHKVAAEIDEPEEPVAPELFLTWRRHFKAATRLAALRLVQRYGIERAIELALDAQERTRERYPMPLPPIKDEGDLPPVVRERRHGREE